MSNLTAFAGESLQNTGYKKCTSFHCCQILTKKKKKKKQQQQQQQKSNKQTNKQTVLMEL